MSPLFVIFGILAIIIPIGLSVYFKNQVDSLTTDNSILKKRNDTLEERFNAEHELKHIETLKKKKTINTQL